ncbi:hypothetical protein GOBAR_AA31882 [Gossypium barbadense]|uniref:FCP1 homology domain-containing protein n=1 Tax=Gossypium barbadense TaxID=3634 RepID=A0A2P5WCI6_GOSBA|nr:hypothetical protein GOBAR_AA31882 [Gossypium barbadense]
MLSPSFVEFEGKPKISYVTVFERPGLQEFLNQLSEFAQLVLFTAGLEGYARPLVDRIDAENRFSHRLYRPSTICTEFREHVKGLSCLSKNLCRTVIVDNNPFSFLLQPLNGIPCIPFSAGQPHDTQLLDVLLPLLKHLSLQKDVRPFLYDRGYSLQAGAKHKKAPMSAIGWPRRASIRQCLTTIWRSVGSGWGMGGEQMLMFSMGSVLPWLNLGWLLMEIPPGMVLVLHFSIN